MAHEDAGSGGAGSDSLVRRLRPDEWRELRALRLRALADAPDAFGATLAEAETEPDASWQQQASAEDRVAIVAEIAGRLVGMVLGGPGLSAEPAAHLGAMWVEPTARGRGVAASLVAAVDAWARAAGYPVLALGVTTSNAHAIALYERLGFVDTGRRFSPRGRPDVEIQVMVRALA